VYSQPSVAEQGCEATSPSYDKLSLTQRSLFQFHITLSFTI
jgi:hypothetical protein